MSDMYSFDIGEPYQSELVQAMQRRVEATNDFYRRRANSDIRSIRLRAARAKGRHTKEQWADLVNKLDNRCVQCGEHRSIVGLEKDHIIPIYQGGSDGIENIQPLCPRCNVSKGPDSFNWAAYRLENGFDK